MKKYIILIFNIILFFGCTMQEQKNERYTKEQISSLHVDSATILDVNIDSIKSINLNPFLKKTSFNFGALVKKISLIPLETKKESLIDDIYKILVTDSTIYIMDDFNGRGIIVFNKNGKFIRRIPNGQGPGELVRLYDIAFDYEKNELIAYQNSFLLFFSPTGEFLRQERLPFGFYNFTVIPNGYIFKTLDRQGNEHLGDFQDYTLLITDKTFKINSVGLPFSPIENVIHEYDYVMNNSKCVSITQAYTDTVYQYVDTLGQFRAKFSLVYGDKKLPKQYLHSKTYAEFDDVIRNNDYYFYNGRYLETNTHNVFFLENYNIGRTVIFRNKQSGNLIGGINALYNNNEIPPIAFPISAFKNALIASYLPSKNDSFIEMSSIISDMDKKKIKGLTEDDNPVLVFYELKNF